MIVCDAEMINGIGGGMEGRRYLGVPRAMISTYRPRTVIGVYRYLDEWMDLRGVGIHEGRIWIREGGGLLVIVFSFLLFNPVKGAQLT
jgi:hypothetical protein